MTISSTIKVNLALLSSIVLWSLSFVAIRIGLEGYTPGGLALFRFLVASGGLVLTLPWTRMKGQLRRSQLPFLIGLGVVGIACYSILLNSGEKTVPAALASFIAGQTPAITAALAIGFLRERPTMMTLLGIGISCFGLLIIVSKEPLAIDPSMGLLFIALAAVCGSLHAILQKHLLRELSPTVLTALATWIAAVALLPFLPELVKSLEHAPIDATYSAIFLGIVPSVIGQWLWTYGLSKTLVVRASAYLYAMPFFSTLFGWLLLNEIPTAPALVGGCIALLGSMMVKKEVAPQAVKSFPKP